MKLNPGTIYRGSVGNPLLQTKYQQFLLGLIEEAESSPKYSPGYKRLLAACYRAAGGDDDTFYTDNGDIG